MVILQWLNYHRTCSFFPSHECSLILGKLFWKIEFNSTSFIYLCAWLSLQSTHQWNHFLMVLIYFSVAHANFFKSPPPPHQSTSPWAFGLSHRHPKKIPIILLILLICDLCNPLYMVVYMLDHCCSLSCDDSHRFVWNLLPSRKFQLLGTNETTVHCHIWKRGSGKALSRKLFLGSSWKWNLTKRTHYRERWNPFSRLLWSLPAGSAESGVYRPLQDDGHWSILFFAIFPSRMVIPSNRLRDMAVWIFRIPQIRPEAIMVIWKMDSTLSLQWFLFVLRQVSFSARSEQ